MNQRYFCGSGVLVGLPKYIIERYGVDSPVLIVHGRSSFRASGAESAISAVSKVQWTHFDEILPNPEITVVQTLTKEILRRNPACVVAVGGGSVIDTAKGAVVLTYNEDIDAVLGGSINIPEGRPEIIAVPTTAGSGSEATHFAVLYRGDRKYSLAHPRLRPDTVFLDSDLLTSCPQGLWLASGADAICQCVESWWNRNATDESQRLAEEGLARLLSSFFSVDREAMQVGANLAGQAINITKTTAGHALSYGLTVAAGIPHGLAVLAVMQMLVPVMDDEFRFFASATKLDQLFAPFGEHFPAAFDALCEEVWARFPLDGYFESISIASIPSLVDSVNLQRLGNHPVTLYPKQIYSIYARVFDRHHSTI